MAEGFKALNAKDEYYDMIACLAENDKRKLTAQLEIIIDDYYDRHPEAEKILKNYLK